MAISSSHGLVCILVAALLCGSAVFVCRNRAAAEPSGDRSAACTSADDQVWTAAVPDRRQPAPPVRQLSGEASIDAAFEFLKAQMDRYHRSTIVYSGDGFGTFYPGGRIGDADDIEVAAPGKPGDQTGHVLVRIDYRPRHSNGLGWAGIYFLYPDGNWGQLAGRNLIGATRLAFWACADRAMRAEFYVGGVRDPRLPHVDSLQKVSTGTVSVTPEWQRYEIDLEGRDLSSVIGGFGVSMGRGQDGEPRSLFLSDIAFDLPHLDKPRFLPSNLPEGTCRIGVLRNSAQIYDQALVLLAFLARRQPDDLRRAELLGRALVEAQHADRTFKDGRLRNAYTGGELIDPDLGTTRLPGVYNPAAQRFVEDENAVGTDTGDMAWAALALVQAHTLLPERPGDPFLNAAVSLANWIIKNTKVEDTLGGFSAGVQAFERADGGGEGQQPKDYRATEHNIDLAALFEHLAAVERDPGESRRWRAEMMHARSFVRRMRADDAGASPYWTGTGAGAGETINKSVLPLDVQTWGVLSTREPGPHAGALDWALRNCPSGIPDAFDFNCNDGDGAWWEGTGQVAVALQWLKRDREATPIVARLRAAQFKDTAAAGALPAASRCGLTTGFSQTLHNGQTVPRTYSNWPHIGATAWFIFALLGVNPYFIADAAPGGR
jgi:hypothetical protein